MAKKSSGIFTPVIELNPGLAEKNEARKQAYNVMLEYKRAFEADFQAQFEARNGKLGPNQEMRFGYRFGGISFAIVEVEPAKKKDKPKGFSL